MTLTLQNSPKSDFCMCITKSSHLIDQHCQDYFFSVRLTFVIKNDLVAFLAFPGEKQACFDQLLYITTF